MITALLNHCLKPLFAVALLSLLSFFSHAAVKSDLAVAPDSAQLQKIMAQLSSTSRVRSRFRQTKKMQLLRRPLISNGVMIYERQQGLYWHIETPFSSTLVVKTDRILQRDGEQETIINARENPQAFGFSQLFFHLLSGDFSKLEQQFDIALSTLEGDSWQLQLRPLKPQLAQLLTLITVQGSEDVTSMTLWDANGDQTLIEFVQRHVGGPALNQQELAHFAF